MKKITLIIICFMSIIICWTFSYATAAYEVSRGEVVMEVSSGRLLYSHNESLTMPMASTTKIITAITIIEKCDLQSVIEVGSETTGIEGSSVYLKAGDRFTVEDLLYGLMLRSGNDCAETLAVFCSGSISAFCNEMQNTATRCGATDSRFANPHGLPCKGHYTTALDLCKITCYALKNSKFSEIVATRHHTATELSSGTKIIWQNKNKLLNFFDGADGVKTGYTKEAGRCFVGSATRGGMRVVSVVLNSPQMFERSEELLDNAFTDFNLVKIIDKSRFDYVAFTPDRKNAYKLNVENDFYYPLGINEKFEIECDIPETLPYTAKIGDKAGEIKIYLKKQLIFSQNIYTLVND